MSMYPILKINKIKLLSILKLYKTKGEVYYPVKANSDEKLIRVLIDNNSYFNVSSIFYLNKLLKLGVNPKKILFDNCLATKRELLYILKKGVTFFTIDSLETYNYLKDKVLELKFLIKVSNNVIDNNKHWKYGLDNNIVDMIDLLRKNNDFLGFSFYISNEIFTIEKVEKMLNYCSNFGKIKYLNIGGGFEESLIEKMFNILDKYSFFEKLFFEPGRSLINSCSTICTKIINIKINDDGKKWIRLDLSIYSGLMDIFIESKKINFNEEDNNGDLFYISGYTSDNYDYFGECRLPKNLKVGDILSINSWGAYVIDMAQNYLGSKKLNVEVI